MHQIVAVDRQQRADQHHGHRDDGRVNTEHMLQPVHDQRDVHHVETDEHKHRRHQRQDHPAITELGAGLDHLRQAHFRTLRTVEGHENRAEHDAERAGQHRPQRRQTQARADKTDGDGEEVEIAEKPEWPLAAEFGVTFVFRDVIDRVAFDGQPAARLGGVRRKWRT
ncbi:hypothetical protein D3C71_1024390 [compost metagenome]